MNNPFLEHDAEFRKFFNAGIMRFCDPITSFDIIKFDEFLKTPDSVSTAQHIEKLYGREAVDFIRMLMKLRTF